MSIVHSDDEGELELSGLVVIGAGLYSRGFIDVSRIKSMSSSKRSSINFCRN